jgi:peptidoglycan/LPS O-acetylase OafA/YrhL
VADAPTQDDERRSLLDQLLVVVGGLVGPAFLVLVGLFVTNITAIRMPPNPFPFVAAGCHGLALAGIAACWKRQRWFARALCALVLVPAGVFFVGNLLEGVERLVR